MVLELRLGEVLSSSPLHKHLSPICIMFHCVWLYARWASTWGMMLDSMIYIGGPLPYNLSFWTVGNLAIYSTPLTTKKIIQVLWKVWLDCRLRKEEPCFVPMSSSKTEVWNQVTEFLHLGRNSYTRTAMVVSIASWKLVRWVRLRKEWSS